MSFNKDDLRDATEAQMRAARDPSDRIRLVAGPGTGKSKSITERVAYLIRNDVAPRSIFVLSYTKASSIDLRMKIRKFCREQSIVSGDEVEVSTLHSLSLKALKKAGLMNDRYPVLPVVLDRWELNCIFDDKFSKYSGFAKNRSSKIRGHREAIWDTGESSPDANNIINPPIDSSELAKFDEFHETRSRLYAYVLPGEMVRLCVDKIKENKLNVPKLLGIDHLIVDEFQDLNPMDLEFIFQLVESGVKIFICGDDDQSVYSFGHASPAGIQTFPIKYISMHERSEPPIKGAVHRVIYKSCRAEAKAIAESCKSLIDAGLEASGILILLSNSQQQFDPLEKAFHELSIPYSYQKHGCFKDDKVGRFLSYVLRASVKSDDYFLFVD